MKILLVEDEAAIASVVRRGLEQARYQVETAEDGARGLEALASHEGHVLSREAIQDRVWMDEEAYSNTVDVYIGMLRKKIDADSDTKLIHTVRGAGYTLRRPDTDGARA